MHNHLKKHYLEFFAAVADRTHVLQKGAIPLDIFKSEELELLTEKYKGIIEEDSKPRIPLY